MKCAYCGKPIAKYTKRVQFAKEETKYTKNERFVRYVFIGDAPWPQTIAECRKHTNQQVVAVSRLNKYDYVTDRADDKGIDYFKEWDGETYAPRYGYFCTTVCAGFYAKEIVREKLGHRRERKTS